MKKRIPLTATAFLLTALTANAATQTVYRAESQPAFSGNAENFTGDVQVQMLFPGSENVAFSGAYVTFQPGARTAWHEHPAGQHMIVTDGIALTGTRDGTILEFHEGETVWCPPDIDHWHGAAPDRPMTHLVITGSKDGQNVIWKEHVTDKQYCGCRHKNAKKQTMNISEHLTAQQQAMIPIAAYTASGELDKLKTAVNAGLDAGLTINETREIMIHLYAYTGFPRALNALGTLMSVVEKRKARGIEDEIGADATALPAGTDSLLLGIKVQTELVGGEVSGGLFDFAPVINDYLRSHLFGDIFSRDVLDFQARELVTVSALANLDGAAPQYQAHLSMALNAGVTQPQLDALKIVFENNVGKIKHDTP